MKLRDLDVAPEPSPSAGLRALPPWAKRELLYAAWALFLALAVLAAWSTPVFTRLEERIGDARLRLYRQLLDGNTRDIVLVAIDAESVEALHLHVPLSRGIYARVIDRLRRMGARVVGVTDVLEGHGPDTLGDTALADALREQRDVVLATRIDSSGGHAALLKLPFDAPTGFVDTPSVEGMTRSFWVDAPGAEDPVHCLSLELVRRFYSDEQFIPRGFLADAGTSHRINFACLPGGAFTTVSAQRVLTAKGLSKTFKDRIVLVGSTLPQAEPEHRTPVTSARGTPMTQLELVANVTHTLVQDLPMGTLTAGALGFLLFAVVFLGTELLLHVPVPLGLAVTVFAAAMWILEATSRLMLDDRLLPLVAPLFALVVACAGALLWRGVSGGISVTAHIRARLERPR